MLSLTTQKHIAFAKDEAKTEAEMVLCAMWENMFVKEKSAVEPSLSEEK